MKKRTLIFLLQVLAISFLFGTVSAQVVKTKKKSYKKAVKQTTKKFKKDEYLPKGVGTLDMYVREAINIEYETDEQGETKNFIVYTSALAPSFESAVHACRAHARVALAGNIETNVVELVKRSVTTDEISLESANGINSLISAGKQLITQKISMEDIYIFYREVKDEKDGKTLVEVEFAACYSKKIAMQKAQEYIRNEMEVEVEKLHEDLDKIFLKK